jgi:glycerol-3-phosphate dehydrogenase
MSSDYDRSVDGPKIIGPNHIRKLYSKVMQVHGKWGTVMHESQMMDTRMNLHALLTSSIDGFIPGMKGATLANYVDFQSFTKDPQTGKITGAVLYDKLKQKQYNVKAKVVVNCAGVHADEIRLKDEENAMPRIIGAKGTHLIFKGGMIPNDAGIIIPKTKDGRLIFVINYLGQTMVGTTDEKTPITHTVVPD